MPQQPFKVLFSLSLPSSSLSLYFPIYLLSTHDRSLLFEIALIQSMSPSTILTSSSPRQRMSLKQYWELAAEYRSSDCYEIARKWFSRNCTAEDNENNSVHLLSGTTNEIIRILCDVIATKRQCLYENVLLLKFLLEQYTRETYKMMSIIFKVFSCFTSWSLYDVHYRHSLYFYNLYYIN